MNERLLSLLDEQLRIRAVRAAPLEPNKDPYNEIPLILQLMCDCRSGYRDVEQVATDVATMLDIDRDMIANQFDGRGEGHADIVDKLRRIAIANDSPPLHDLADRVLIRLVRQNPIEPLLERLMLRLRPFLQSARELKPSDPHRRAAEISSARLLLLMTLYGGGAGGAGFVGAQARLANLLQWVSTTLIDTATTAAGDLDEEIEAAQLNKKVMEEDAQREPEVDEEENANGDEDAAAAAPLYGGDNDHDDGSEDQPALESLVVLKRLPSSSGSEAKHLLESFEGLVGKPVPLVPTPDLAAVRNTLVGELPHLESVIDTILAPLAGQRSIRLPPTLLAGRAGCGKTTLAERLMAELGIPFATYDAAGVSDAMILGSNRRWTNAAPGLLLDLITGHEIANPGVIVDELDKLGGSDRNGDLRTSLLGLFEPRRAKAFLDRFLDVPVNYSHINWLATANETFHLPSALMSRLRVLKCPMPSRQHLEALAPQLMRSELASRGLDPRWYQPLTQEELQAIGRYWKGGSIRKLKRLVNGVMAAREKGEARQ